MPSDLDLLKPIHRKLLFKYNTHDAPRPDSIVPCLICGKPFLMGVFIGDPDQLCPLCAEEYRNTARVICKTCRVTVMRVEPGRLDNGFQVYPGQVLHLDACNVCKPGIKVSRILEIAEWERLARPSRTFA